MKPTGRYNAFNLIHKALRGMMYDAAVSIQRTDFTQDSASETLDKLQLILDLMDEHAEHEDNFILPNVEKHDPKLVAAFEEDHVVDHRLTDELTAQIHSWQSASNSEERAAAGLRIFYAFNEFIAFNLYHMNREENELLAVLWKHFTDQEILGMQAQIVASIKPEILQIEAVWMVRMASVPEIAGWMAGVRATAPAEMFAGLMHMAEMELEADRFDALASILAEAPAMA
jgi:hypothetical protein